MPKINAGLTVSGNIEGYSIYSLNGKWVLRKAGGFKGSRIKKDPNYEKTRQSNQFYYLGLTILFHLILIVMLCH